MMRWIAWQEAYEPGFKSDNWGSPCVVFEFTDRPLNEGELNADPKHVFHAEAMARVEANPEERLRLFEGDLGYRMMLELVFLLGA